MSYLITGMWKSLKQMTEGWLLFFRSNMAEHKYFILICTAHLAGIMNKNSAFIYYSMMTAEPADEVFPLSQAQILRGLFWFCDNLFPWITGLIWLDICLIFFSHFPTSSAYPATEKRDETCCINGIFLSVTAMCCVGSLQKPTTLGLTLHLMA